MTKIKIQLGKINKNSNDTKYFQINPYAYLDMWYTQNRNTEITVKITSTKNKAVMRVRAIAL